MAPPCPQCNGDRARLEWFSKKFYRLVGCEHCSGTGEDPDYWKSVVQKEYWDPQYQKQADANGLVFTKAQKRRAWKLAKRSFHREITDSPMEPAYTSNVFENLNHEESARLRSELETMARWTELVNLTASADPLRR